MKIKTVCTLGDKDGKQCTHAKIRGRSGRIVSLFVSGDMDEDKKITVETYSVEIEIEKGLHYFAEDVLPSEVSFS